MTKKQIDLNELLESATAGQVAERLAGKLTETGENPTDSDFAASGKPPSPPPPSPPPPAPPFSG